jgi:molybdopterin-guanine dinucleotide biosynthesis protein A
MGGVDKALLPLAGRSLLAHVLDRFEPQVERVMLSVNGPHDRFARFGLPLIGDDASLSQTPQGLLGPLAGVLAGLCWAAPLGATGLVTVPVDCPFLPPDLVPRLCLAAQDGQIAMVRVDGRPQPTFALWPMQMAPILAHFLGSGAKPKMMDFATAQGVCFADFAEAAAFQNLNTPEDLLQAESDLKDAR